MSASPVVTEMRVIPVAGRDSMLLNLAGAHGPFFIRNVVLLKDNAGRTGVGEVPGGAGILRALENSVMRVVGSEIGSYNRTLNAVRESIGGKRAGHQHQVTSEAEAAVLRQPHEINLRLDNVITAIETALLDLLGQYLGVPLCELLGNGRQRDSVRMLAYLFYIGERTRTDLAYPFDPDGQGWYRHREDRKSVV